MNISIRKLLNLVIKIVGQDKEVLQTNVCDTPANKDPYD